MKVDIIILDSVLKVGISTNLDCSPIKGQKFRGSIVTHKITETIANKRICRREEYALAEAHRIRCDCDAFIVTSNWYSIKLLKLQEFGLLKIFATLNL